MPETFPRTLSNEALERFAVQPPPRRVPAAIRQRVLGALLRGPVGILLICATLLWLVPILFFRAGVLSDLALDRGHRVAPGVLIEAEGTAMAEGRTNRQTVNPIVQYVFSYQPGGAGTRLRASCYGSGQSAGLSPGQAVEVEYLADSPGVARIRGCRCSAFGAWPALTVLLPLAGYLVALLFLARRARSRRLLVQGRLAHGLIEDVWAAGWKAGGHEQHRVHLAFELDGESQNASCFAGGPQADWAYAAKQSRQPVRLLSDPRRPERILLLDWLAVDRGD